MILLAAVLVGAQAGVYGALFATGLRLPLATELAINAVFIWLGFAAVAKRMHDLGAGTIRLGVAIVAWVALAFVVGRATVALFGEEPMVFGGTGYLIVAASVFLPVIAGTIWLHCAPGDEGGNRFGPVPGATGLSRPRARGVSRYARFETVLNLN